MNKLTKKNDSHAKVWEKINTQLFLNMQMLVDDLEDAYELLTVIKKNDNQKLRGAALYWGQSDLEPEKVYIADSKVFEEYPIVDNSICRIIIGKLFEPIEKIKYPVIVVSNRHNWQEVFNSVQSTFMRYYDFVDRLHTINNNNGGIYEFVLAADDFFENPVYIHDMEFNVIALSTWVVGMTQFQINEDTGRLAVPVKSIKRMYSEGPFADSMTHRRATLWDPEYGLHRDIYYNLFSLEDVCFGRILINELKTTCKPSDFIMLEYFAKFIQILYERGEFNINSSNGFDGILKRYYQHDDIDESYLLKRLQMIGWSQNNNYVCIGIHPKDNNYIFPKIKSSLSMNLRQCFSFKDEDNILAVCNLSKGCNSDYERILAEIASEQGVIIATSNIFNDFKNVDQFLKQATEIISINLNDNSNEGVYLPFEHMALDYIINFYTRTQDLSLVCPIDFLDYYKRNDKNKPEILNTLRAYLSNNCQQTATANELFIHRSTLLYRLSKIEKILGLDMTSSNVRMYIQLVLKLLDSLYFEQNYDNL